MNQELFQFLNKIRKKNFIKLHKTNLFLIVVTILFWVSELIFTIYSLQSLQEPPSIAKDSISFELQFLLVVSILCFGYIAYQIWEIKPNKSKKEYFVPLKAKIKNVFPYNDQQVDILNDIKNGEIFCNNIIFGKEYLVLYCDNYVQIFSYNEIVWAYASDLEYKPISSTKTGYMFGINIVDKEGQQHFVVLKYGSCILATMKLALKVFDRIEDRNSKVYLGYDKELEKKVQERIENLYLYDKNQLNRENRKWIQV